jgi:pyridoxal phosphate enzyme (YggS family)
MSKEQYQELIDSLGTKVTLVAVSKLQSVEAIMHLYRMGQRDFGENYVQELVEKQLLLPHDIRWHFIGHLQSNKIKYIASFVHLVQSVDSFKLLMEINRQGKKSGRVIDCLLQVHIADEETKFGLNDKELEELVSGMTNASGVIELDHIRVTGLMGMASFSQQEVKVRSEMQMLASLFDKYEEVTTPNFKLQRLSMGMSADYLMAIEEGSTMVRIGSLLFGKREKL